MSTRRKWMTCALLLTLVCSLRADEPATIKIAVNSGEVPELNDWMVKAAQTAADFYPTIVRELGDAGYTPPASVDFIVKKDEKGVAYTRGHTIVMAPAWFKAHPDDVGAIVHEMCHVVQSYHHRNTPGWVVEGLADYVRWFKFEPVEKRPRVDPRRAKYTDSYRTTAAFFDWIVREKDPTFARRLNEACRAGQYSPELFTKFAGASVDDLWQGFIASLTPRPSN